MVFLYPIIISFQASGGAVNFKKSLEYHTILNNFNAPAGKRCWGTSSCNQTFNAFDSLEERLVWKFDFMVLAELSLSQLVRNILTREYFFTTSQGNKRSECPVTRASSSESFANVTKLWCLKGHRYEWSYYTINHLIFSLACMRFFSAEQKFVQLTTLYRTATIYG